MRLESQPDESILEHHTNLDEHALTNDKKTLYVLKFYILGSLEKCAFTPTLKLYKSYFFTNFLICYTG